MSLLLVFNLLALFTIGFVQDVLGAYYLRLVTEQRYIFATMISFIHSLVGWGIWIWFIYQFQNAEAMSGFQAVIYSAGGAIGTYLGLKKPGSTAKPMT